MLPESTVKPEWSGHRDSAVAEWPPGPDEARPRNHQSPRGPVDRFLGNGGAVGESANEMRAMGSGVAKVRTNGGSDCGVDGLVPMLGVASRANREVISSAFQAHRSLLTTSSFRVIR